MRFMLSRLRRVAALAAPALLLLATSGAPLLAQGDGGLSNPTRIASVNRPTALAFDPRGRLYVASQAGVLVRMASDGSPRKVALDLRRKVCDTANERGLLGVAVDPAFAANRFVYLYYTGGRGKGCDRPVNRVSRFVAKAGGKLDRSSERVLLNNIPSPNGNHNGGDLQFGGDGLLYVSIGDGGGDSDNARKRNVLSGKIVRITRAGTVPAGNPYRGAGTERCHRRGRTDPGKRCQEIWATGLRNPFRIAFSPDDGTLHINDVGQQTWEEINVGQKGADYGWNICEGEYKVGSTSQECNRADFEDPAFAYQHDGTLRSITGGAFVPEDAAWPDGFLGNYLFADLSGGIFLLVRQDNSANMNQPVVEATAPVHLTFHDDALYYADIGTGSIFRVEPAA